jgi:hypothetical protein
MVVVLQGFAQVAHDRDGDRGDIVLASVFNHLITIEV